MQVRPQGAVASPLLANVYMHYLFDLWADAGAGKWRRAISSSFAMPTILYWVFSTERMLNASLESSGSGWRSSAWNYIRTRHDSSSSGGSPLATGNRERGENLSLHVPGLYPLLWATPQDRNLHRLADHGEEANGCEAQSHQG
jgi:hypothetical protein